MLVIEDIVCNNENTQEEILKNCIVDYTDKYDLLDVVKILHKCFKIPSYQEALEYVRDINVDLDNSVKYFDPGTNEIYGLLLMADNTIDKGIPFLEYNNPLLLALFNGFKQKEGAAFILDKRIRGLGLDKWMLQTYKDTDDYKERDMIWCGVQNELKSHGYWKHLGFTNFYNDKMAKFYLKLTD